MHARLAIASDALDTSGLPVAIANVLHKALVEDILAHGRLVFGNKPEADDLLRAVTGGADLPQDARTRWRETLAHLLKHKRITLMNFPAATPLANVQSLTDLRRQWGSCADVAILASQVCANFGVPLDSGVLSDPTTRPDIATAATATATPAMTHLRELSDRGLAARGSLRETFWIDVLEPLATDVQRLTVLDGYLFKTVWAINDRERWTRYLRLEHTAWLLDHLDSVMAPGAEVHLIGSVHPDYSHQDVESTADLVRQHWGPLQAGRLKAVSVSLATPRGGQRFPHDRHIRFSNGSAIELSAGFDRLREETIWDPDGMKWKYHWRPQTMNDLQRSEERAVSYAGRPSATVLQR